MLLRKLLQVRGYCHRLRKRSYAIPLQTPISAALTIPLRCSTASRTSGSRAAPVSIPVRLAPPDRHARHRSGAASIAATARKLPAILAFLAFIDEQRTAMGQAEWAAKFGHAHARIARQILPAFGDDVVAQARTQIATHPPALYLPPEARA